MRLRNVGATLGLPLPSEGPADADVFPGFRHLAPPSAIVSPAACPGIATRPAGASVTRRPGDPRPLPVR